MSSSRLTRIQCPKSRQERHAPYTCLHGVSSNHPSCPPLYPAAMPCYTDDEPLLIFQVCHLFYGMLLVVGASSPNHGTHHANSAVPPLPVHALTAPGFSNLVPSLCRHHTSAWHGHRHGIYRAMYSRTLHTGAEWTSLQCMPILWHRCSTCCARPSSPWHDIEL